MSSRVVRRTYVWVRVDWVSTIAYPVIFVTALTALGIILIQMKLIGGWYSSPYVAVVALIANRVCFRSGLVAAGLSALEHEFCFAGRPWHFDMPLPEQALSYLAMFGVAYVVGRRTMPPPTDDRRIQSEPLPFTSITRDDRGEPLSRSFWEVEESGDWGDDSLVGSEYGRIYVDRLRSTTPAPLLCHVVKDMMRRGRFTGIEAGFLSTVSHAASGKIRRPLVLEHDANELHPD